MRTQYVLETARRRVRSLSEADAARAGRDGRAGRRWLWALVALAALAGGAWVWYQPFDRAPAAAAAPTAQVPEHQRTGPLANPWGSGPIAQPAANAADAPAAPASAAAAASAPAAPPPASAAPPSAEQIRAALARLRSGAATAFVQSALKAPSADHGPLVVAWMAERQCRQWLVWRQISEFRARAQAGGRAPEPEALAGTPAPAISGCEGMSDAIPLEAALEAAGFVATSDQMADFTRRPLDLAQAVAVGDPALIAEVVEATPDTLLQRQLAIWGGDGRESRSEVLRAGLWWASCTTLDAKGQPATGAALRPGCKQHPALWQACVQQGLCDLRDLRDLFLRTLPAEAMNASERIARAVAPRVGGK